MIKIYSLILLCLVHCTLIAQTKEERQAILDAARPKVEKQAGQAVLFKVDTLNVAGNWAVVVGELRNAKGGLINWHLAKDCDVDLDKLLWMRLHKNDKGWQINQLYICSPEPPYWYLKEKDYQLPCAIYKGLYLTGEETAEMACRQRQKRKAPKK